MPTLVCTPNLARHFDTKPLTCQDAHTVAECLAELFARTPQAKGYLLEDDGSVRKHVVIFVNGKPITDRLAQSDPVQPADSIQVFQALSGG